MYKRLFSVPLILFVSYCTPGDLSLNEQYKTVFELPDIFQECRKNNFFLKNNIKPGRKTLEQLDPQYNDIIRFKRSCKRAIKKAMEEDKFDMADRTRKKDRGIEYVHRHCLRAIREEPFDTLGIQVDIQKKALDFLDVYTDLWASHINLWAPSKKHFIYYPYPVHYREFLMVLLEKIRNSPGLSVGDYEKLSYCNKALIYDLKKHTYGRCESIFFSRHNREIKKMSQTTKNFFLFLRNVNNSASDKGICFFNNQKVKSMQEIFDQESFFQWKSGGGVQRLSTNPKDRDLEWPTLSSSVDSLVQPLERFSLENSIKNTGLSSTKRASKALMPLADFIYNGSTNTRRKLFSETNNNQ